MRKSLVPTVLAALVAVTPAAFAASHTTKGVVSSYNVKSMTLKLKGGATYLLPKDFENPDIKAGTKVAVVWETKSGKRHADTVTIAK